VDGRSLVLRLGFRGPDVVL